MYWRRAKPHPIYNIRGVYPSPSPSIIYGGVYPSPSPSIFKY